MRYISSYNRHCRKNTDETIIDSFFDIIIINKINCILSLFKWSGFFIYIFKETTGQNLKINC